MDGSVPIDQAFEHAWSEHPLSWGHAMTLIIQSYKDVARHFWHLALTRTEEPVAEPPAVFEMFYRRTVTAPVEDGREYVGIAGIRDGKVSGGELIRIGTSQAVLEAITPVVQPCVRNDAAQVTA